MKEFLNSQASAQGIVIAISITACIIIFLIFNEKLSKVWGENRINYYLKKNRLETHSTIFYKGGYWVVMKYLKEEKSYSIMSLESKKTNVVDAKDLIQGSISQEKLLNALASADTFTEFYSGNEHLLKKYLDDV